MEACFVDLMLGLIFTHLFFVLWGNAALASWFCIVKDFVDISTQPHFSHFLKRTTFQYFHLWFNPGATETAKRFYKYEIKIMKVLTSIKANKLKNKVLLGVL